MHNEMHLILDNFLHMICSRMIPHFSDIRGSSVEDVKSMIASCGFNDVEV